MNEFQTLLAACIATVIYPPLFMVAFDRFLARAARRAEAQEARAAAQPEEQPAEKRTAAPKQRPLRGLAAEPTVLPRTVLGARDRMFAPVNTPDDMMPGLLASLDTVPSTPRGALA